MTTLPLETPIKRGTTDITEIQLRKPAAGELRGISLAQLLNIDAGAVMLLLPRITTPTLTAQEVAALDVADLTAAGLEIAAFLLPRSAKQDLASPATTSDSQTT